MRIPGAISFCRRSRLAGKSAVSSAVERLKIAGCLPSESSSNPCVGQTRCSSSVREAFRTGANSLFQHHFNNSYLRRDGLRYFISDAAPPLPSMTRRMSNLPEATVYGGPKPQSPMKRVTLRHLEEKYAKGEPISMVTAYDYPSAVHVEQAGIDILLVGDSVGMVVHGHDTTLPVTMEDMLLHCKAVSRGASRPLLVGDLPFGSYEQSPQQAVQNATRLLKEGNMDAVKMEGGVGSRVAAAKAIAEAGIAVMGHVGLTPQAISVLGGFRPQGRSIESATQVLEHALALEKAGCFSMVLECIPSPIAAAVTAAVGIPTIGIGAGPRCSGQVLVYHDLLGMMQHPHYVKVTPKFCKQYASIGLIVQDALVSYRTDVQARSFPSDAHTPYRIDAASTEMFLEHLHRLGLGKAAEAAEAAAIHEESIRQMSKKGT